MDKTEVHLLAFSQGGRVGVMTADGKESVLLSPGPGDYSPVWSPDGAMIAFTRLFPQNQRGTYVMKADGSGVKKVLNAASYYMSPIWASDGQRLAMNDHDPDRRGLWTVKADGTDAKQIFKDDLPIEAAAWSPDGKTIAFTYNKQPTTGGLYLIDANGGEPKLVVDVPNGGLYRAGVVAWSPDGTHLAVRSNPQPAKEGQPAVSPTLSIVKVEKDGGVKVIQRVSGLVETPWIPAWHISSYTVAALMQGSYGKQQLVAVSRDTGKAEILGEQARMRSPMWSGDGGTLMAPAYDAADKPRGMVVQVMLKDPNMSWDMSHDMTDMMKPDRMSMMGNATQIAVSPKPFVGSMPSAKPAAEAKSEGLRWADMTWKGFT